MLILSFLITKIFLGLLGRREILCHPEQTVGKKKMEERA